MESSAVLRSFSCTVSRVQAIPEKPCMVTMCKASLPPSTFFGGGLTVGGKNFAKQKRILVSCVKTSEATERAESVDLSKTNPEGTLEKNASQRATFPNGFEALVLEVCDETEIAELKLKVGDFEMHLKRNVGATTAPMSGISPATPPPIPTEPMTQSASAPPAPSPPKTSLEKSNPFANVLSEKSSKLAALEASGASGYVLVSSPTVGLFCKGRTVKGKKQPSLCKQGDVIKEGQVIGYVDQFGCELPVKSDIAGEVLKVLFEDGEPVGYGDPLLAILPAFHGINIK